jgi:hypothetical protein
MCRSEMLQNLAGEIFFISALSLFNLLLVDSDGIIGGTWPRDNDRDTLNEVPRVRLFPAQCII